MNNYEKAVITLLTAQYAMLHVIAENAGGPRMQEALASNARETLAIVDQLVNPSPV